MYVRKYGYGFGNYVNVLLMKFFFSYSTKVKNEPLIYRLDP